MNGTGRASGHAGRTRLADDEFDRAARRVRAEMGQLAAMSDGLRTAMRDRIWSGPAADRFAASIARRLREIDDHHDLLDILAGQLEAASRTPHAAVGGAGR